eukprot:1056586-Prorocentrum_minimum.AAC.1
MFEAESGGITDSDALPRDVDAFSTPQKAAEELSRWNDQDWAEAESQGIVAEESPPRQGTPPRLGAKVPPRAPRYEEMMTPKALHPEGINGLEANPEGIDDDSDLDRQGHFVVGSFSKEMDYMLISEAAGVEEHAYVYTFLHLRGDTHKGGTEAPVSVRLQ